MISPDCRHHPGRVSTHVVDIGKVPVCDECAGYERENGLLVRKHIGYLWGYPMLIEGEDEILDAKEIG